MSFANDKKKCFTWLKSYQLSCLLQDIKRYKHCGRYELHEPSLWVIISYRIGRAIRYAKPKILARLLSLIHLPFYMILTLLTGIHIPRGAKIGPGLRIWHFGGIILNPDTLLGANCTIRQGVTIGNKNQLHDVPVIGDNVDIGAGAKLLGAIRIGNNVSIGANAVVLKDVPDNCIAVGVPAKILLKKQDTDYENSCNT